MPADHTTTFIQHTEEVKIYIAVITSIPGDQMSLKTNTLPLVHMTRQLAVAMSTDGCVQDTSQAIVSLTKMYSWKSGNCCSAFTNPLCLSIFTQNL